MATRKTHDVNVYDVSLDETMYGYAPLGISYMSQEFRILLERKIAHYARLKVEGYTFSASMGRSCKPLVHAWFRFGVDRTVKVLICGKKGLELIPDLVSHDSDNDIMAESAKDPDLGRVAFAREAAAEAFKPINASAAATVRGLMASPEFVQSAVSFLDDWKRDRVYGRLKEFVSLVDPDVMHRLVDEIYVSEVVKS